MTNITKATEITSVWTVLFECLQANLSDPLTGDEARSEFTHWIFDEDPNPAKIGQPAPAGFKFPIVILNYPNPETENASVDGSKQFIEDGVIVECRSRSALEVNELTEEIKNILETTANSALNVATLHLDRTLSSPTTFDFIGGNKFFIKSTEYIFRRFD